MADNNTPIGDEVLTEHGLDPDEELYEAEDSVDPPPEFDPHSTEAWPDMRDPWFTSDEEAENWEGESEFVTAEPEQLELDFDLDDPRQFAEPAGDEEEAAEATIGGDTPPVSEDELVDGEDADAEFEEEEEEAE